MYDPPPAVDDEKYQRALERAEAFERASKQLEAVSMSEQKYSEADLETLVAIAVAGVREQAYRRVAALEGALQKALKVVADRYAGGRMLTTTAEAGDILKHCKAVLIGRYE